MSLLRSFITVASVLTLAGPLHAAVVFSSRDVTATVTFTQPDFSDAAITIDATTQVGEGSSGERAFDFTTSPNLISTTLTTTGNVSFTAFDEVDGNITGAVHADGAGSFTFHNVYATDLEPFGQGPLVLYAPGVIADLPVLELFLPIFGAGLVDEGGVFTINATFPGNYSSRFDFAGDPLSGQHLLYLDYAFDLPQNFVYDPATNQTVVSASDADYAYPTSAGFDAYLFGRGAVASVPEPASWAMMIVGFAATGAVLRSRRAAKPALA